MSEYDFLNNVAKTYVGTQHSLFSKAMKDFGFRFFRPFMNGANALELGSENAYFTKKIAGVFSFVDVVEGARPFADALIKEQIQNVNVTHSLFEEFQSNKKYDAIFACYILEHVADVKVIYAIAQKNLAENGFLFIIVPNAKAFSRQLALRMNLIDSLYDLTENDLKHGHRRCYDLPLLRQEITANKMEIAAIGGLMLKPFADFQMNQMMAQNMIGEAQLEGLFQMGLENPDMCGSLCVIVTRK